MPYVKPQVLVYQEFQRVPSVITDPLRAHISGGHAALHRYSKADEKADIELGEYEPLSDTNFAWPGKASGSLVDLSYVKLFLDDALLLYFSDLTGADSTIAPVAGYGNRVRSSSVSFKDNNTYDRSAALLRDVLPGDTVYVRGSNGGDTYELWSYVRGFKGETVAAAIGAAEADAANAEAQSAGTSIDHVAGPDNNVVLTADGSAFNGLAVGLIDETYTVEVVSGSVNGDFTTARLRITSASGLDNVASKTPSPAGGFTDIGTLGLAVEFDVNPTTSGSSAALNDEAAPNDLVPGQKWRVRVLQQYTAPTATASGTYTGTWDTSYIVECTRGGGYGAAVPPQITVSTTTGVDVSGPTSVTAAATAVAVGSQGARIAFASGSGLRKGDKWLIEVTAQSEGAMRTLILGHDLPAEIQGAADLDLKLFIKKNIEVSENRVGFAPLVNWESGQTEFTVKSGISAYDDLWVDTEGDPVALDVVGGTMYVEYREWLGTHARLLGSLDDAADVTAELGTVDPDNPLAYAVSKALANSAGSPVRFTAVSDPTDIDSWAEVLELLGGRDDVYSLVPLTTDRAVQDLFAAHVANSSTAEAGRWRGAFFNLVGRDTVVLADADLSSDGNPILAKLEDDPDTSGTQYTYLTVTSGNAELDILGVLAGDVVRYLFTTDGFVSVEYTEFVVEEVVSETTLRLASGHSVAVGTPQKLEVWRNNNRSQIAADVATRAGSFGSRRVCVVWPDKIGAGGVNVPGYFLAAALAGLRSGVVPHQGLTNVEIAGFDDVTRTSEFFSNGQLDTMAESGVWIVTQTESGTVYTRHALTTDMTDVNSREEVVRANVDSMSAVFLRNLQPFIGRANVTPATLTTLRVQLDATIEFLKANGFVETLGGGQLIDGTVTQLRQHALLKDRIVATVNLEIPYPINNIELHLVV